MGGFRDGVLIWNELEEVCGRKMGENAKIGHFLSKNPQVVPVPKGGTGTHYAEEEWYQYPLCIKVVPVPIGSVGLVPVLVKVVRVLLLPATLFFCILLHR